MRLMIDLGARPSSADRKSMEVNLVDSRGAITAEVKEVEECDPPRESGWMNGVAYLVGVACPPRGLNIGEKCSVSVILGGTRFKVGEAIWTPSSPESAGGASTTASSPSSLAADVSEVRV